MKISLILLSCLCGGLAITVHYEPTGSSIQNKKENQDALKDIRLVAINQSESLQKPEVVRRKERDEFKSSQGTTGNVKVNRSVSSLKLRANKKKPMIERIGTAKQTVSVDQNHQNHMQKMANQLFMAQKHALVLSDYQKFILNQDQNIKSIVLGQSAQERNPKSFARTTLLTAPKYEPVNTAQQKIVVITPKVQKIPRQKPQSGNDHSAQAAQVKYVTLAPQSLTHFVEPQELSPKVTLLPFHSSEPYAYYNLAVTGKPQAETVSIPSTSSLNSASFEPTHYYKDNGRHEDILHHENSKYEFMYKVKDHEKHSDFGHKESRNDKTTYGYYYVHLPDGRLETVRYWADKTGYHAKVDYQGEAKHPMHSEHKLHSHNFVHL